MSGQRCLEGQIALVTGGRAGRLAREGAHVILFARGPGPLANGQGMY
jgi:hypothetical protein